MPWVEVLIDADNKLTPQDLAQPEIAQRFAPIRALSGISVERSQAIWIRFTLETSKANTGGYFLEYLNPIADRVELFIPKAGGVYTAKVSGDTVSRGERDLDHRNPVFRLPVGQTPQPYFLRLSGGSIKLLRLTLWDIDSFYRYRVGNYFLLGLYYGVIGLLAIASLLLVLVTRERIFLSYGLYLLVYGLMQASINGLTFQFLWPNAVFWADRAPGVLVGLSVAFGILFIRVLLETKRFFPVYDKVLLSLLLIGSAGALLNLLVGTWIGGPIVIGAGLLLSLLAVPAGWMSLKQGNRSARYFLFAWSIFLCGVFVTGLSYLGLIPARLYTINAMQAGSSFEAILLLLAVSERIRRLRWEREHAERQARSDGLTGLLNHKAFVDGVGLRLKASSLQHIPATLVMIDLDYFKNVNDRFGHQAGDRILEDVARLLGANTRYKDLVGRYGGEEFALLLWDLSAEEATATAQRMCRQLAQQKFSYLDNAGISASFGVAHAPFDTPATAENMIRNADTALYRAKRQGRNRVEVWREAESSATMAPV